MKSVFTSLLMDNIRLEPSSIRIRTLKMDTFLSLLVVSTLPQFVVPDVSVAPYQAVIQQVSGDSRIFSKENIRLRCSIPDARSTWTHLWFRGAEKLQQSDELILWRATVKQSGKYYCQGVRDTVIGPIHTLQSRPLEIDVDGGWIILHVSPHPRLVGETLSMTCRVRDNPKLAEVILYRDEVEVVRQNGLNPHFHLPNITLKDQGLYSCRATWNVQRRSHSAVSVATQVHVLEVLTEPILEVVPRDPLIPVNMMKLICHLQYNAHAPAPPIHYYFYKNGNKLAMASSENNEVVKRTPGHYRCKARVPELGLVRWSETETFGQVTGTQQRLPPTTLQPRDSPLAPPSTTPVLILIRQPTDAPETVQSNNQTGDTSDGDCSDGDCSDGDSSDRDCSDGDSSDGDSSDGDSSDTSGRDSSRGDTSGGDSSGGDKSGGDASGGDASGGDSSYGDSSGGDTSGGDTSGGDSSGDHFAVLE